MVAPLAVLGIAFLLQRSWARGRIRQEAEAAAEAAAFSGPDAPIPQTQYPKIDASRCIGCGACARACPEDGVLGVVAGRSRLLNPLACVGHATCVAACPVGAVQLELWGTLPFLVLFFASFAWVGGMSLKSFVRG